MDGIQLLNLLNFLMNLLNFLTLLVSKFLDILTKRKNINSSKCLHVGNPKPKIGLYSVKQNAFTYKIFCICFHNYKNTVSLLLLKIIKLSYNSFKHRNICSPMLEIKETQNCACSIERKPLTFVTILLNKRKKAY